jgi:DNA-binding transcriptional regulator YbjK
LTEGRRPRGERRRRAILDATLALVGRKGAGAVTHRAVAEEAGVPLAATTYYFASKNDLLRETLAFAAEADRETTDKLARALAGVDDPKALATTLADHVNDWLGVGRPVVVSHYEISLEGARRPELAEIDRAWTDRYVATLAEPFARLGSEDPTRDAWLVVSTIEGMVFNELSGPRPRFEREILRPTLERLVCALLPAAG